MVPSDAGLGDPGDCRRVRACGRSAVQGCASPWSLAGLEATGPVDATRRPGWSSWIRAITWCGVVALGPWILVAGVSGLFALAVPILLLVAMGGAVSWLVDARQPADRCAQVGWWIRVGATAACAVICLSLAAAVSSACAVLWLVALALTSPPARQVVGRWLRGTDDSIAGGRSEGRRFVGPAGDRCTVAAGRTVADDAERSDAEDALARVAELRTVELCQLWRASHWMVREARPRRALRLVRLREEVLDELERRHPDAVNEWLSSGHHTADGPTRYL